MNVGTVIWLDKKILLVRQLGDEGAEPGWTLPGGGVDTGETAVEAAAREALEETGIEVISCGRIVVYAELQPAPRLPKISCFHGGGYGRLLLRQQRPRTPIAFHECVASRADLRVINGIIAQGPQKPTQDLRPVILPVPHATRFRATHPESVSSCDPPLTGTRRNYTTANWT